MTSRIVASGCGGFLNPPTHPEHTHSVEHDRECMSLSYASTCDYIGAAVRDQAKAMLANWQAPPIDAPEIQEWIAQVLGYFARCYRNPGKSGHEQWHASHLIIDNRDPFEHAHEHAGVHMIRGFYPSYHPTRDAFKRAYWGSK